MSRSFKKNAIVKQKGYLKEHYWKNVRSSIKNFIRSKNITEIDEISLPVAKEIVGDYDYVDQISVCNKDCRCGANKCKRK